jgi:hypothetical protein
MSDALRARTEAILSAVRGIDPGGAQSGPLAAQALQHALMAPEETGQPDWSEPVMHAVRLARSDGWREEVLLVAFCLQIAPDGLGRVTGLLLAGDEGTADNTFVLLPPETAPSGVALEQAIDRIAADAAAALPAVVQTWTSRISAT